MEDVCQFKHEALDKLNDLYVKHFETEVINIYKIINLETKVITTRLDEMDHALILKTNALDDQVKQKAALLEQKLEKVSLMLPRTEYALQHKQLEDEIRLLRESKVLLEGKASQRSVTNVIIFSVINTVLTLLAIGFSFLMYLRH